MPPHNKGAIERVQCEGQFLPFLPPPPTLCVSGHDGTGRTILEGRTNGKRKQGRPRNQWQKDIEDVLGMPITEVGRLAINRDEFRTTFMGTKSCPGQKGQNENECLITLNRSYIYDVR